MENTMSGEVKKGGAFKGLAIIVVLGIIAGALFVGKYLPKSQEPVYTMRGNWTVSGIAADYDEEDDFLDNIVDVH